MVKKVPRSLIAAEATVDETAVLGWRGGDSKRVGGGALDHE
jgi:hypothetical protein